MDAQQKEVSSVQRQIEFRLTAEEFEPYRESRLAEVRKKAKIKGYRPGTAPMNLVKKLYGAAVMEEAVEEAVQKTFVEYAKENEIQPFGNPAVTAMQELDDGGVEFTISYDVLPEVELGEYKGLTAQKIYHAVTTEEIDAELEWLRDQHRTEETVDTIADGEHTAVVDFQKLDESGAPLIGEVSRDVPVDLRSERINPELRNALIGARLDDTVNIKLPTGENETDIPYAMTIKDIKQLILPEVDNEFAAKIVDDEEADVEDLKDTIKQSIEAQYDAQYSRLYRDQLIDKLIDAHDFEVPNTLVGQVLNGFLEDEKKNFEKNELPEDYPINEFIAKRSEQAIRVAKWLLLRDLVVEKEEITVTDEDYEALAQMDAQRIGMEPEQLLNYYKENDEVHQRIIAEKVIQLLADYSEVEEEIDDIEWRAKREEEEKAKAVEAAGVVEEIKAAAEAEIVDEEDATEEANEQAAEEEETEEAASEEKE